ncbi:MAG: type 4a pilus biogenesis protein PilO [Deltaproteobacteria bacterium]|nr:type 4a pilus biogenesis protein PilO [Deltaproteobacteria bacterium]MBW1795229.1 type 4a pilus biogenesis protein PilO [Deltaproteobacteria bacterium]
MTIKKLSRSEQILIVVGIAVIATFFYVRFVYDPTSKKFSWTMKKHERLAKEVNSLRFQVKGGVPLEAIEKRVRKAEKELKKAERSLPCKADRANASMSIVRMASKFGFDIRTYEPEYKPKKAAKFYKRKYINMVLRGKFCNLTSFLKEIREMPLLVLVENLAFRNGHKAGCVEMALLVSV